MNKRIHTGQFTRLFAAHFKEIIRKPEVIFWGVIFPILMSLGLGIAFTGKGDIVRTIAVIDPGIRPDPAGGPAGAIGGFLERHAEKIPARGRHPARYRIDLDNENLGRTTFYFIPTPWEEARTLLKRGNLNVIMEEAAGRIQYHFDPLNTDAQLTYLKLSAMFTDNRAEIPASRDEGIRPLALNGTRYIDFLIPGLIAMNIMMSCMWGMSYGTIEKRSRKLLRRMVATPMRKSHYLASLMAVRILMNFIEGVLLVVFAWLMFDVSIQGSIVAVLAIFIAGNIAFGGIAMFTSSRTASTEAGNGLINAIVMPMMVLSGIFFSYHNFPDWSIPLIRILPLTMLTDGIRSVFIEGAGISGIALPTGILTAIGIFFFSIGLKIFKWH
jgi:ABC-type multidrug transport system permease subunit